jgi:hypothetical protein
LHCHDFLVTSLNKQLIVFKNMKIAIQNILAIIILLIVFNSNRVNAQFWTENFTVVNTVVGGNANGYNGANGVWTVTSLPGDSGLYANMFYISCQEAGMQINNCGAICAPVPPPPPSPYIGQSLHISSDASLTGDNGALYIETGSGNLSNTEVRAESPTINCNNKTDIVLTFNYIENGESTNDNADVWYFDGSTWSFLFDMDKTLCGDGTGGPCNEMLCDGTNQGFWTASPSISLPVSADNNPNVKFGFRWINNDDGDATDPSLAITNIQLNGNNSTGLLINASNDRVLIYPNPSENNTTLEINSAINETVFVFLYNSLGQVISEEKIKLMAGRNQKEIATQKLGSGFYSIKIVGTEFNAVKQFIKK